MPSHWHFVINKELFTRLLSKERHHISVLPLPAISYAFSLWPLISFVESEISWSSRRVRWCWFDDWWRHHQPISVMSCNDNRNFAIYAVQGIRNHARSPMGHLWRNSLHEGFRAWCGLGRNNYFVTWQCSICFSFCYNTKCKRVRSMDLPLAQTTL